MIEMINKIKKGGEEGKEKMSKESRCGRKR
jgi:hypothetical protein